LATSNVSEPISATIPAVATARRRRDRVGVRRVDRRLGTCRTVGQVQVPSTITTEQGTFVADVAGADDAPVVVLLHGFPQSRYTWRAIVPALAGAGFRAVAPDQRGYTPGVRPDDVDAYASTRLVGDVLDILDALGVERAHLVGHDWGGQVAWLTAAHHPDRVTTLTVLSRPHPAAFARSFELDQAQADRSKHHQRMTASVAERLWANGCAGLRTMLINGGVPAADADAYVETFAELPALDAAMNWYRAAAAGGGLRASATPSITVPTLYLWGTSDATVGRVAAELTRDHVTGPYTFVEIEGAGHFLTDDGAVGTVERELLAHVTG
jgi:pimeloyl-ACP methyl ester carboxylesterase